jgi:multidrug efflux pump subunit AcrA (membrane-fusion protein)
VIPKLGERVRQGDIVAELDSGILQAQLQRAQAGLARAEAQRARLEQQARPEEVAVAQAMLDAAQARVAALSQGGQQTPSQALTALAAARQRLATLEGSDPNAIARAAQSLETAASALDAALRDSVPSRARVDQANAAVNAARQDLITARQQANPTELAQAREAVAAAERQVIASALVASPHSISEARATLEAAQHQLTIVSSPASEAELAAAQAEVDQAAATLELARQAVRGAVLTAPMSGAVGQQFVDVGSLVGPGVAVIEIHPQDLRLEFSIPEAQVSTVQVGQEITVSVAGYPKESFSGVVSATAPSVDPRNRQVLAQATVSDPQGKLKAGMFAQILVNTGTHTDALVVPQAALVGD